MATDTGMELAVMILAPVGRDARLIADTLQNAGLTASVVESAAAAIENIKAGVGVALIAEEALDPNSIRGVAEALAAQPAWSDLPVVIMTGSGGSNHATDHLVA